jgi:hypothetical protein
MQIKCTLVILVSSLMLSCGLSGSGPGPGGGDYTGTWRGEEIWVEGVGDCDIEVTLSETDYMIHLYTKDGDTLQIGSNEGTHTGLNESDNAADVWNTLTLTHEYNGNAWNEAAGDEDYAAFRIEGSTMHFKYDIDIDDDHGFIDAEGDLIKQSGGGGQFVSRDSVFFCTVEDGIGKIKAADLDGGNVRDVLTGLQDNITDIEVDSVRSKIYWVESNPHAAAGNAASIWRAHINGSNVEKIRETAKVRHIQYIELDVEEGKIYWEEGGGGNDGIFYKADLNGDAPEELGEGFAVYGIAVHVSENRLYFADDMQGIMYFAFNDPENKSQVFHSEADGGLELDTVEGKIYWTEWQPEPVKIGIYRVNFDGSGNEQIISDDDCTGPFDLALDLTEGKIYWTDLYTGVWRCNLDGSELEPLLGLDNPDPDCVRGIALYQ